MCVCVIKVRSKSASHTRTLALIHIIEKLWIVKPGSAHAYSMHQDAKTHALMTQSLWWIKNLNNSKRLFRVWLVSMVCRTTHSEISFDSSTISYDFSWNLSHVWVCAYVCLSVPLQMRRLILGTKYASLTPSPITDSTSQCAIHKHESLFTNPIS